MKYLKYNNIYTKSNVMHKGKKKKKKKLNTYIIFYMLIKFFA